jgi:hypothetical protein
MKLAKILYETNKITYKYFVGNPDGNTSLRKRTCFVKYVLKKMDRKSIEWISQAIDRDQ